LLHLVPTLAVLLPLAAAAAPQADADRALKRGVSLRAQRKDAEALEEFKKAYALVPSAHAMAQIALAEQALGAWVEAEQHLQTALADATDPWIKKRSEPLSEALRTIKSHLGDLEITGPDDVAVEVDGRAAGKLPLAKPLRVVAGARSVAIAGSAVERTERTVDVPANGLAREHFSSAPATATPPVPTAKAPELDPTTPPTAPKMEPTSPIVVATKPASEGVAWETGLGYAAFGGALLGAGVGTVALVVRAHHVSRYNDDAICLPPNGKTRQENCGSDRSAAMSAQTAAIVGFAGAAALAITGAVLWIVAPSPTDAAIATGCGPGPGTIGMLCAVAF
jgi:hypothetical protein